MTRIITIIGADSYIATRYYESSDKKALRLYSPRTSGKKGEIIKDLFAIDESDFLGTDVVVNFAAKVHQSEPNDDSEFKRVNTDLPVSMAVKAKSAGAKHFIQMSTVAVYGNLPFCDVDTVYNAQTAYGRTKLEADFKLQELEDDKFKVSIVRPPIVYGGGLSPGNMQKLVRLAMSGAPLPFKLIDNKRDALNVYNLVHALHIIIDAEIGGIFMPTDKKTFSIKDIINIIDDFSSRKTRKIALPAILIFLLKKLKPALHHKLFGDSRVKCNMPKEYQPQYSLENGISEIVKAIEESE